MERHALGTRLAVVFVTAHADPPTIERARRAGCAGYLVKPFAESAILDAVHQAMITMGRDRGD